MNVTAHPILRRHRSPEVAVADARHFKLGPGKAIDERRLLDDPHVTLYCLDRKKNRALFVATPPGLDLATQPFVYQAQFKHATEAIVAPLDRVEALSEHALRPKRLVFLYSVGRCGSTLLQRALNHLPGVTSISEPDVLTQLTELSVADGSGDAEITRLARISLPFFHRRPGECLIVKPRSFTFELSQPLSRAFPTAQTLFMYRNAEEVVASFLRLWDGRLGLRVPRSGWLLRPWVWLLPPPVRRSIDRAVPLFRELPPAEWLEAGLAGVFFAHWQSLLRAYLRLSEEGRLLRAIDYADLLAAPTEVLAELAAFLDIPGPIPAQALASLAADSQEGTALARGGEGERPRLTPEEAAKLRRLVERLPGLQRPDVRLPWSVGTGRAVAA